MMRSESGKDGWVRNEMFHEDGGKFHKIGGAASSGDVVIVCSTDHSCVMNVGLANTLAAIDSFN